ncbi:MULTISPECIES: hypothetical protein [Burkholderia]|uniref:hypothetical protein n=1 Tax=Burkholderia TaxID=32008 RepID=UPI0014788903|nr:MULTISPECIES: hypothetical protein [Burkholderia]MBM2656423.1 hypothetical protein [Burkholderia diffusa]
MRYTELSGFFRGFQVFLADDYQSVDTFSVLQCGRAVLDAARVSDYRVAASIHPTAHAFRLSFFRSRRDSRRRRSDSRFGA